MTQFSEDHEPCPVCNATAALRVSGGDLFEFLCPRCGRFDVTGTALSMLRSKKWSERQIANASGWVGEQQSIRINSTHIQPLASLRTPTVEERSIKILLRIHKHFPDIGATFELAFNEQKTLPWLAPSWSKSAREVEYLFIHSLMSRGFIAGAVQQTPSFKVLMTSNITPAGHAEIERLQHTGGGATIGFCAMWFSPALLPVWTDAISPAISDAGYAPKRIDSIEHNNKIDDEIIATIRKSRFVIADFSGNRGGVYFEAGFAVGLNLPVIWTNRAGRLHRIHFDNRQYNFLEWRFDELPAFRDRLKNRIEATIGHGPISP